MLISKRPLEFRSVIINSLFNLILNHFMSYYITLWIGSFNWTLTCKIQFENILAGVALETALTMHRIEIDETFPPFLLLNYILWWISFSTWNSTPTSSPHPLVGMYAYKYVCKWTSMCSCKSSIISPKWMYIAAGPMQFIAILLVKDARVLPWKRPNWKLFK